MSRQVSYHPPTTEKISFGCEVLDSALGGGIPCKSITEITGESGIGKTQICLQLALTIQIPRPLDGLSFSTLYIQTKGPFPFRRLVQLRDSFHENHPDRVQHEMISQVFIERIDSIYQFMEQVPTIFAFLTSSCMDPMPVKLLVIDDVTSLFSTYFDSNPRGMSERANLMRQFTSKLKEWATMFNLAVVITNQVVDFIPSSSNLVRGRWEGLQTSGRRVRAALGDTWTSCIQSRLFMSKDIDSKRYLQTSFGGLFRNVRCEYFIFRVGVFGNASNVSAM